ncbi:caspase family protein [Streptomyces sp. NPDC057654]|uniref:caspase family protein n=1 Tax=Streptomyces sp. NPDC057654 TaxID=3346196 RepID=UPI0036AFB67E
MDYLPCPERSRAVLIGTSGYSHLDDLPAVRANVLALEALLCATDAPFRPESCVALVDPSTTVEVSKAVQKAAREATDTLLIYYAGHGLLDDLKQAGYLDQLVVGSAHYGPKTCQAVARLNREHLLGKSPAPNDDPRITHKGWDILNRLARSG